MSTTEEGAVVRVDAADTVDPLRYVAADGQDPARVLSDVVHQAAAGAALAYAIYHGGKEFILSMPDPVLRAYGRACEAYEIGRSR